VGIVQTKRRFGKFEIDGDYCEKCKKIILDAEVGK